MPTYPTTPETPRLLGQLLMALMDAGAVEAGAEARALCNMRVFFQHALKSPHAQKSERVAEIVAQIGELPAAMTVVEQGRFWLGYYQDRLYRHTPDA